jgi:hypothetical protein
MNNKQIQAIAEQALSDMCLSVQTQLGIDSGDVASRFFDLDWRTGEHILAIIKDYVCQEIQCKTTEEV